MINFDPRFTQVIYLDTECYVPPEDRQRSPGSLIVNPGNPRHFLLGGVFCREFPLQQKLYNAEHFWGWEKEEEKDTLTRIYGYFQDSWRKLEGKSFENPDLIIIGAGVSRFDIPMLFVRSLLNRIDSVEKLYETYFKTKIVDLGDVGIPLFTRNPDPVLYPKTINALTSRLQIETRKLSGKTVWEMYDSHEFDAIKARTAGEVEIIRGISSRIIEYMSKSSPKHSH